MSEMVDELTGDTRVGEVYLVRRYRPFCYLRTDWSGSKPLPGRREVRVFSTREEADAFCEDLCYGRIPSPPDANPFLYTLTGFDGSESCIPFYGVTQDEVAEFVQTLGFEPPERMQPQDADEPAAYEWGAWWERHAPTMTDEQRSLIWQKSGGLPFYEVVKLELHAPPGDPLHAANPG